MRKKFRILGMGIILVLAMAVSYPAFSAPAAKNESVTTFWDLVSAGGVNIIFLTLLSIAALASILYHFKTIQPQKMIPVDFCENLVGLIEHKEYAKAISICRQQPNPSL